MTRHLLQASDLAADEIRSILATSRRMQSLRNARAPITQSWAGKHLMLLFDEPSIRTRSAFGIAVHELGGVAHSFSGQEARFKRDGKASEHDSDLAAMISGFFDACLVRVYDYTKLARLASLTTIPFISGMCDRHHPTQALCDAYTIISFKERIEGLKIAFIGDFSNVARSDAQLFAKLGARMILSCPPQIYEQDCDVKDTVQYEPDARRAARDADVILTDVWLPMHSTRTQADLAHLIPYRVSEELCSLAKTDFIFLHNLPAYRSMEVMPGVIDGPNSVVHAEGIARLSIARGLLDHFASA